MEHLEQVNNHCDGLQNLPKGLLRNGIAPIENGSLHFITSAPIGSNAREQEYIESTLLGTDLLSSQLPTNLLTDYITPVPCSTGGTIGGIQSTLLEHHYRPFTSDELQSLVDGSAIQAINGNDVTHRKLFQPIPNKATANPLAPSNEAAVIVTSSSRDIPSFGTITSYEKMLDVAQPSSPLTGGLAQIAGAIDGYVHFSLSAQLHATGSGCEAYDMMGNSLGATHHHQSQQQQHQQHYGIQHHHNQHHSHHQHLGQQSVNHKTITDLVNCPPQEAAAQQSQNLLSLGQPHTSLLSPEAAPLKDFNNAIIPGTSAIVEPSSIAAMTIPPLRPSESSKRYYLCPQPAPLKERSNGQMVVDGVGVVKDTGASVLECEPRTDGEEDTDSLVEHASQNANATNALPENINLPHKKRLTKKLGDPKENVTADLNHHVVHEPPPRGTVIANEAVKNERMIQRRPAVLTQAQNVKHSAEDSVETVPLQDLPGNTCFRCQLCGQIVRDQLVFFNHLKEHYEPEGFGQDSKLEGEHEKSAPTNHPAIRCTGEQLIAESKKPKPKLPRVKHTKKLKHDRTFEQSEMEVPQKQQYDDATTEISIREQPQRQSAPQFSNMAQNLFGNTNTATVPIENGGEFSETEDMLEGIRSVVQETVDRAASEDMNLNVGVKQWFTPDGAGQGVENVSRAPMVTEQIVEKETITFVDASLAGHDIQLQNESENFVLFLNKSQFNDNGLLEPLTSANHGSLLASRITERPTQLVQVHLGINESSRHYASPPPQLDVDCNRVAALPAVPFATHPNAARALDHPAEPLMIPSILQIPSNRNDTLLPTVPFHNSTPCKPVSPDLKKAKLLNDEQMSDSDIDNANEGLRDSRHEFADHDHEVHERLRKPTGDVQEEKDESGNDLLDEEYDFSSDDVEGSENEIETNHSRGMDAPKKSHDATDHNKQHIGGKKVKMDSKTGNQKYLCEVEGCDRQFKSSTAFQYHRLQHTGVRPHKCGSCGKSFFTCSALKVHERLHSGEKPYKCDQCGHSFRQWGDLKYHRISIHTDEKSHKCEFCGKEFSRRYSLVVHRRIHTNERNFICDYCNKGFRASTYLQAHRKIHTGEKPHQCKVCDKKFRSHGDINRHMKTHSRAKGRGKAQTADDTGGITQKIASASDGQQHAGDCKANVIDLTKSKPKRALKVRASIMNHVE